LLSLWTTLFLTYCTFSFRHDLLHKSCPTMSLTPTISLSCSFNVNLCHDSQMPRFQILFLQTKYLIKNSAFFMRDFHFFDMPDYCASEFFNDLVCHAWIINTIWSKSERLFQNRYAVLRGEFKALHSVACSFQIFLSEFLQTFNVEMVLVTQIVLQCFYAVLDALHQHIFQPA